MSGDKHRSAKTGGHGFQKYGKTKARRSGKCAKDDVDLQGRWKLDSTKPSSTYEDTFMPFSDARVAFQLCHGGPVGYDLAPESGLSDEWIAQQVTPNISGVYGEKMAAILGKALLWACCDEGAKTAIDPAFLKRVLTSYDAHNDGSTGLKNSVLKVGLMLRESNGVAIINSCSISSTKSDAANTDTGSSSFETIQRLEMVDRKVDNMAKKVENIQSTLTQEFEANSAMLRKLDRLQRRMAAVPGVRGRKGDTTYDAVEGGDEGRIGGHQRAVRRDLLSKSSKDLFILWKEYEFGLGGRKPARLFTVVEKGMMSSVYSKRNKVWTLIQRLINKRHEDSKVVIDSIYDVYGPISVTEIIRKIQQDGKTGGHPNLR